MLQNCCYVVIMLFRECLYVIGNEVLDHDKSSRIYTSLKHRLLHRSGRTVAKNLHSVIKGHEHDPVIHRCQQLSHMYMRKGNYLTYSHTEESWELVHNTLAATRAIRKQEHRQHEFYWFASTIRSRCPIYVALESSHEIFSLLFSPIYCGWWRRHPS